MGMGMVKGMKGVIRVSLRLVRQRRCIRHGGIGMGIS